VEQSKEERCRDEPERGKRCLLDVVEVEGGKDEDDGGGEKVTEGIWERRGKEEENKDKIEGEMRSLTDSSSEPALQPE